MMFGRKHDDRCCDIWNKFERIRTAHSEVALKSNTEMAYRFYEGDQWYGLGNDETLPVLNFIKPTVNYKVSMVAMNAMSINYSVIGHSSADADRVTKTLNLTAERYWERLKMDIKCWEAVKAAMIAGDSYVYFYDGELHAQIINNTDMFLADEQQRDIQKQPFIIIAERRPVKDVIRDAKKYKIPKDRREDIISDEDIDEYITTEDGNREIKHEDGKCTCLLYMELKENGDLEFCRCTRYVEYQPKQTVPALGCYPVASLVSNPQKGSARGRGEVRPLINNQIEVNRNLARRILNAKLTAFSKLVYASDKIQNPQALLEAGTAIEIEGSTVDDVRSYINYIAPAQMSSEAANLTNELMAVTRDLAGAGDAALGNVDPTQASGTAIIAVRDQASIPLNEQTADFKQFVEDIARIWLCIFKAYNPDGISADDGVVLPEEIEALDLTVKIDVSSKAPFSKYAREQSLERLFSSGHISFEEYVKALDSDSTAPKSVFERIVKDRENLQAQQMLAEQQTAQAQLPGTLAELEAMAAQNNGDGDLAELEAMAAANGGVM